MPGALANSQNLVTIKNILQDTLIMKNGTLCQVILVGGINFSLKSEEEQNLLTVAYQNFLNSIDFSLQILIHSRKINIDHYLDDLGGRLTQEQSPLLQNQISEYREFIRQFVSENAIMEKMFLVIVPWHPAPSTKGATSGIGGLVSGFKMPFFGSKGPDKAAQESKEKVAEEEKDHKLLTDNLPQLAQRVGEVTRGLAQMGLDAAPLKGEELAELFYNFYNPESVERETAAADGMAKEEAAAEKSAGVDPSGNASGSPVRLEHK